MKNSRSLILYVLAVALCILFLSFPRGKSGNRVTVNEVLLVILRSPNCMDAEDVLSRKTTRNREATSSLS